MRWDCIAAAVERRPKDRPELFLRLNCPPPSIYADYIRVFIIDYIILEWGTGRLVPSYIHMLDVKCRFQEAPTPTRLTHR